MQLERLELLAQTPAKTKIAALAEALSLLFTFLCIKDILVQAEGIHSAPLGFFTILFIMPRQEFCHLRVQITGFQRFVLEANLPSLVSQFPTSPEESLSYFWTSGHSAVSWESTAHI